MQNFGHIARHGGDNLEPMMFGIRRRNGYIIGFIAPAIGPNKSKKLTRLIAQAHNIRGKVQTYIASQTITSCL